MNFLFLFVFRAICRNFAETKNINIMDFEGKVVEIFPARSGVSKASNNNWTSQDVLFEVLPQTQYPRKILVSFFNKADEVARLSVGGEFTVSIDITAREYNGRWYNDIRAWRVQPKQTAQAQPQQAAPAYTAPATPAAPAGNVAPMPTEQDYAGGSASSSSEVDDLPF